MEQEYRLRRARAEDVPAIRAMHRAAFEGLAGEHYTPSQIEGFLADVETVDPDLIEDGTYYVVDRGGKIAASGGWTMRRPTYVPNADAQGFWSPGSATIRSVFTAPDEARKGLAARIMDLAEEEAVLHGMADRITLCATMSGLPLYIRRGYAAVGAKTLHLSNGTTFPAVAMSKTAWVPRQQAPATVVPAFRIAS